MSPAQSSTMLACGTLFLCALVGAAHWDSTPSQLRTVTTSSTPALRVGQKGLRAAPGPVRPTTALGASVSDGPEAVAGNFGVPLPSAAQLSAAATGAALGALASLAGLALALRGRRTTPEPFAILSTATVDKGADPKDTGSSDARSEQHRIDQRIVYNMGLWRKHRAASRYTRAILSVPQSYVINHVANPVLVLSLITAGLCALEQYIGPNALALPTSLFSLSAPSLGLLLVFRTNASYERWDGARKMIGLVKNRSEDLTRQICTRFPENRADLKEQFLRYLQAFFFSLKVHLRSAPGGSRTMAT
eukprot:TRINITY_DN296_c0_g1_i5.p1 TRINITY_DN296_c0_g1~~TRINITY_DN296_c0_g1_i5.p1  ORF type:complete len:312 (+),score=77.79 TRINITY_DN296_c0_g1_i5:23-937(+)